MCCVVCCVLELKFEHAKGKFCASQPDYFSVPKAQLYKGTLFSAIAPVRITVTADTAWYPFTVLLFSKGSCYSSCSAGHNEMVYFRKTHTY